SYSGLKALVSQVIDRVEKRIEFMGTPRKGTIAIDKFYEIIENSLKSIITFFQQAPEIDTTALLLVSFFSELLRSANECAGRYFLTAVMEYNKICKGVVSTFEEEILLSLAEYRKLL